MPFAAEPSSRPRRRLRRPDARTRAGARSRPCSSALGGVHGDGRHLDRERSARPSTATRSRSSGSQRDEYPQVFTEIDSSTSSTGPACPRRRSAAHRAVRDEVLPGQRDALGRGDGRPSPVPRSRPSGRAAVRGRPGEVISTGPVSAARRPGVAPGGSVAASGRPRNPVPLAVRTSVWHASGPQHEDPTCRPRSRSRADREPADGTA